MFGKAARVVSDYRQIRRQRGGFIHFEPDSTNRPSLSNLASGETARVIELQAGSGACSRLMGLGIHNGADIRVIRNTNGGGPILVEINDTRVGLGRGICERIIVSPIKDVNEIPIKNDSVETENHQIIETCECVQPESGN